MFSLSLTVWNKGRCIRHCLETAGRFDMPFSTNNIVGYSVHELKSTFQLSQVKRKRQWPMPNRGRDTLTGIRLNLV